MMKVQNNLKAIRNMRRKTQDEVAADLGVTLSTYRTWEQGRRNMSGQILIQLSNYFSVTTDTILGTKYAEELDDGVASQRDVQFERCVSVLRSFGSKDLSLAYSLIRVLSQLNETGKYRLNETADDMVRSQKYISMGRDENLDIPEARSA